MSRPATTNLKANPPIGSMPVLQYCSPDQLQIDDTYQRSLESAKSQALIRRIAVHWDWGLCQPLFVARRADGVLYVVDGQHRLAAAMLRGDLWQLPCVVSSFASAEEEAAAFVSLNRERCPLNQLEIFKAALAAGDMEATQIVACIDEAGLALASTTNNQMMKVGHLSNIGGLRRCYRQHGLQVLTVALRVLATSYPEQVLRYAGTLFPGIATIVASQLEEDASFADGDLFSLMAEMVGGASQHEWAQDINLEVAAGASSRREAAAVVFRKAWSECLVDDDSIDVDAGTGHVVPAEFIASVPAPSADPAPSFLKPAEMAWCEQCDQKVSGAKAAKCSSRFCSLKQKQAA